MRRGYADTPDGQIHYRTDGEGEPLLLLHSTPMNSDQFSELIPYLAKEHRVIAMDTIGYGNSDKPRRIFRIEDFSQSIAHFLDAVDIEKTSVFGNFTGATLAIEMATKYPDRVDKLVIAGVILYPTEQYVPDMPVTEDGSFLMKLWESNFQFPRTFVSKEAAFRMFVSSLMAGEGQGGACHAVTASDNSVKMPLIKSPTLIVSGDKDYFFENVEQAQQLIPRCKTSIIEGGGFSVAYQKPAEFAAVVIDFLREPGV